MCVKHLACLTILAAFIPCLHGNAKTVVEAPHEAASTPSSSSFFSGELGITVANQYMTRGFVVQAEGISFQPYLDLTATFYEGDGFVSSASAFVSLWSAIGSTPYQGTDHGGGLFTEFDYSLGFAIDFAKRWTFTTFYNRWTSPTGAYEDGDWISAIIEFDDHDLLPGTFSLEPFLQITHEFNSELAPGLCFEPGIRPNVTFFPESNTPINAGMLMIAGLGSGYYGVDYGYFAVGPQLSLPLSFIPPSAGRWELSAECLYFDFGSTTTAENGKDHDWLANIKLSVSF